MKNTFLATIIFALIIVIGPGVTPVLSEDINSCDKYLNSKEFDRAIACYNGVVQGNPQAPAGVFVGLGMAYSNKKEFDLAIQEFDRAIRLAPDYAWAYNFRGHVHAEKGHRLEAIADFRKALSIDPSLQASKDGLNRIMNGANAISVAADNVGRVTKQCEQNFALCLRTNVCEPTEKAKYMATCLAQGIPPNFVSAPSAKPAPPQNMVSRQGWSAQEQSRISAFERQFKIGKWVRRDNIIANPFSYKGMIVGLQAWFIQAVSENEAIFANYCGLACGPIFIRNTPVATMRAGEAVVLAVKVIGMRTLPNGGGSIPDLEFVGIFHCTDSASGCTDFARKFDRYGGLYHIAPGDM
jgi:hypothetical protein